MGTPRDVGGRAARSALVAVAFGAFLSALAPEGAAAQSCTTEARELAVTQRDPGPSPVFLSAIGGRSIAAWIEADDRVAVLDLSTAGAAAASVEIPVADLVALDEIAGGMLVVTHAPCAAPGRARCLHARALGPSGAARGPVRSDRVPDRPQVVRSASADGAIAYGVTFAHATPLVIRYAADAGGALTAIVGGGRGRGEGRAWYASGIVHAGGAASLLAWELLDDDTARTVLVETRRAAPREITGEPEGVDPYDLRLRPDGELEVILRRASGAHAIAGIGRTGRLYGLGDVPAERPYVPRSGDPIRCEYRPTSVRVLFYDDPAATGAVRADALLEPVRGTRPGLPHLRLVATSGGAVAVWLDHDGVTHHVRAATIRCAPRAPSPR